MTSKVEIESYLARIALGEREAFDQLYALTSAKLFGVCLCILEDHAAAADALQEAYVEIWQGADTYRAHGLGPMGWLTTVTRDLAVARRLAAAGNAEPPAGDEVLVRLVEGADVAAPRSLKAALDRRLFAQLSVWETLGRWAIGAVVGAVAAAGVAFVSVFYVIPAIEQTVLEAELAGDVGVSIAARYESRDGSLTAARLTGAPEAGRVHELWLILPGRAPVSLGLLDESGRIVADLSVVPPEAVTGAVLAVSEEPPGGSPTGAPTGSMLAAGPLARS